MILRSRPLSYEESIRVLVTGTCGANIELLRRETGVSKRTTMDFLANARTSNPTTLEALGTFVWRQMNSHLLLCDSDRATAERTN